MLRVGIAIVITVLYASSCLVGYLGLDEHSLINVIQHVVLVSGIVPLSFWLALLLVPSSSRLKLLLLAIAVTMFHYFVAVVTAHVDGAAAWSVQLVEIATLWPLLRMLKRKM
jgi:hypothetical protein